MLHIAICDDTPLDCQEITSYTRKFFQAHQLPAQIIWFHDPFELLEHQEPCDLYLLDVVMPRLDGIQLARRLRLKSDSAVIVFITSSIEFAVTGYQVHAAGFILKPLDTDNYNNTMERILYERFNPSPKTITVTHNRTPLSLTLSKILYIESRLHLLCIHLNNGENLSLYQKLGEFEEQLVLNPQFVRCHKSYIVNLDYADTISSNCFHLYGGEMVPISRSLYANSKTAFYHHKMKGR